MRRLSSLLRPFAAACALLGLCGAVAANGIVLVKNQSSDHPIVIDQDGDYLLDNVSVSGLTDAAGLTLTGRINSITLRSCSFGNIRAGDMNKAAGLECIGATVSEFLCTDSTFYDAENTLASLREGNFGLVTFQHCSFRTTDAFLKKIYADNPLRTWPPRTEFYNIDRLELLDNTFSNTVVVIHPSVKKVIIRGDVPLQIEDKAATQVVRLEQGQAAPVEVAVAARRFIAPVVRRLAAK